MHALSVTAIRYKVRTNTPDTIFNQEERYGGEGGEWEVQNIDNWSIWETHKGNCIKQRAST